MARDDTYKQERNRMLLWWYFKTLKELGSLASDVKQSRLYAIAGEKVFISPDTARKVICKLWKDKALIKEVGQRVEEDLEYGFEQIIEFNEMEGKLYFRLGPDSPWKLVADRLKTRK